MEEAEKGDILDNGTVESLQKRLWTIRLLTIGGAILVVIFLVATFWNSLGLKKEQTVWLAIGLMVSFGINLAGFIVGLTEFSKNKKRALFGIIGNFLLVLLFVSIVAYSLSLMPAR